LAAETASKQQQKLNNLGGTGRYTPKPTKKTQNHSLPVVEHQDPVTGHHEMNPQRMLDCSKSWLAPLSHRYGSETHFLSLTNMLSHNKDSMALPSPRRRLRSPGSGSEQAVLSTKTAATLLCAACSPHMQTGSGGSELPYYGRSPPVYPSRKAFSPTVSAKPAPLTRRRTPKHPAMAPQMSDGLPHTAMPGTWSRS
jgi:hypothetical protein